jgi:hypothetical protein
MGMAKAVSSPGGAEERVYKIFHRRGGRFGLLPSRGITTSLYGTEAQRKPEFFNVFLCASVPYRDVVMPREGTTAGMPEVEQCKEQLPRSPERPPLR